MQETKDRTPEVMALPSIDDRGVAGPTQGTAAWCSDRGHPWVTYHPGMNRTWCRCGARQAGDQQDLDWDAKADALRC